MKSNLLKGATLVVLVSTYCQGFNIAPNRASQVISWSTRSSGFSSPSQSSKQLNHISKLYSSVADGKEVEKSTSYATFDPADEFNAEAPAKIIGRKIPYSELTIGVLKENYPGENRVSIAPESAKTLVDAGFSVVVESGGE